MDEHDTPVAVSGLGSGMLGVAAGHIHSCAISATDRIKCWGDNARGQLGDGTTTRRLTPVEVVGFEDPRTVTVAKSGSGAGTVTSIPAGIACGTSCAHAFAFGTSVTLTATAAAGSVFTGWSGSCSGPSACIVTTDANRAVTATFKLLRTLSVQRAGTGSGRIVGLPGAIECGATCSAAFADGTSVALTAIADAGSTF